MALTLKLVFDDEIEKQRAVTASANKVLEDPGAVMEVHEVGAKKV
jgi:hypothetical protein